MLNWLLMAAMNQVAGGGRVNCENITLVDAIAGPGTATATSAFASAGTHNGTPGTDYDFTWMLSGAGADYDIYVTGTGDTPTGSAIDTWLNLGSARSWTLSSTSGSVLFTGTYTIRDATTLIELGSNGFLLNAEVF